MNAMEDFTQAEEVEVEIPKEAPEITPEMAYEFLGPIDHFLKVDVMKVGHNKYRLNGWSKRFIGDSIVPTNRIEKTKYVKFVDGYIVDETI